MKKLTKYLLPGLMLTLIAAGLSRHMAQAQLDPGVRYRVLEKGPTGIEDKAGEVYVVDRAPNQTVYEEDWVLYPNYQYPGPRFMGMMSVVPSPMEQPYASQSDFFRTVPFAAGSKFVRVTAEEFTSLPKSR